MAVWLLTSLGAFWRADSLAVYETRDALCKAIIEKGLQLLQENLNQLVLLNVLQDKQLLQTGVI